MVDWFVDTSFCKQWITQYYRLTLDTYVLSNEPWQLIITFTIIIKRGTASYIPTAFMSGLRFIEMM